MLSDRLLRRTVYTDDMDELVKLTRTRYRCRKCSYSTVLACVGLFGVPSCVCGGELEPA